MGMLNITKTDVLKGKAIPAGWFVGEVTDYEEAVDKDGAALHKYKGVVLEGPHKDHPMEFQFSEKAPGFAINFLNACAGKDVVGEDGGAFDMKQAVGKKLKAKNEPKLYNGRTINNWVDFMANA